MVSLAKLLKIRQGIEKNYKNMGLEKISVVHSCKCNDSNGTQLYSSVKVKVCPKLPALTVLNLLTILIKKMLIKFETT
jgi:hypothetical protein